MRLSRKICPLVCLLFALLLVRPGQAAEPIRINGSGSGLYMMKPLIDAYGKEHPEVSFEMDKPLGTSGSIKALLAGAMDIALTSRTLKPEEVKAGAISHPYGQTPLAMVSHKEVNHKDISTQDLVDFYGGTKTSWPTGKPLRLILRPVDDSDTKILRKLSPEVDAAMAAAQQRPGMTIAVTDPEAAEAIAKTPGALGASGLTGILVEKLQVNVMRLNGVEPTPEAIAKGEYPLVKPLGIATMATVSEEAKRFLAFVYSPAGRGIATSAGVLITAPEKSPW